MHLKLTLSQCNLPFPDKAFYSWQSRQPKQPDDPEIPQNNRDHFQAILNKKTDETGNLSQQLLYYILTMSK